MKCSLRGDRLFIITGKVEEKKIGSIIIPDNHSERSRIGRVMAIGPEVFDYKVGDKVLISWYTGTRVHLDGETMFEEPVDEDSFRIVRECEILCEIVEEG